MPKSVSKPSAVGSVVHGISRLTDFDLHLFRQGRHANLYDKLGSHQIEHEGTKGALFSVWAPAAKSVAVIGDFNGWNPVAHPLGVRWDGSGIWEGFIPGISSGEIYKYHIVSHHNNYRVDKGDPFAFWWELPPRTGSKVWSLDYHWHDEMWMGERKRQNDLRAPMSVYEVHLGSWRRDPRDPSRLLSCQELAQPLAEYVKMMGFTHVEFLPVMEHPFYGSWGYQTVGYFAPSSRYGTPQDFMSLIDYLHQQGIGVILDWVPSHFPADEHGLAYFDGTHLFEHADPKQGYHPDWKSSIFNYDRHEVRSFLTSSALFWLDKYHADGLRVDAVASMLYLDYSRQTGEWIPNRQGGRENLEALEFIRQCNQLIYERFPDVQMIAEESTAWPMVSRPVSMGGLGFGMKWNMGWMHDTLVYMSKDPVYRKHHHNQITFSIWYAFFENFVLPLSHDEVVHGKGSLIGKMPGDDWQKFANLRLLLGYMFTHPGKKLLFMGGEFAQRAEWNHEHSLEWHLLQYADHQGIQTWVRDLNHLYRSEIGLHTRDFEPAGFRWIDCEDWQQSIVGWLRFGETEQDTLLIVANFTPVSREQYRLGVPSAGLWREALNSDASIYGGTDVGNGGALQTESRGSHGYDQSLILTLPPLGILVFTRS